MLCLAAVGVRHDACSTLPCRSSALVLCLVILCATIVKLATATVVVCCVFKLILCLTAFVITSVSCRIQDIEAAKQAAEKAQTTAVEALQKANENAIKVNLQLAMSLQVSYSVCMSS